LTRTRWRSTTCGRLHKFADAAEKDREEFRIKTADGGNKANDLDELLMAIIKALSTPSETKH
jgi:hypothetical protein